MRLLVIGDIHESKVDVPKDVDAVFIAGDFTNAGNPEFAEDVLKGIEVDVLAVPGNMDKKEVLRILEDKGVSVHEKVVDFKGYRVMGFGGSSTTPFGTPMEFEDSEIERRISGLDADIALFHDTPHGLFDWIGDKSVGSKAIRKWIEEKKPKLVFCAHIHEHKGVAKLGETLLVKVPPAYKKEAVLVEFEDLEKVIVRFINL